MSLSVILTVGVHEISISENTAAQDSITVTLDAPAEADKYCLEIPEADPRLETHFEIRQPFGGCRHIFCI